MTIDRRPLAGALAALLLVAACGGSASQSPGASQAPAATQTPAAATQTPTPTQEPTATETPESSFEASFVPGAAGDLEALLPSEVNGVAFTKASFTGESIPAGTPIGDSDLEKLLADNGKTLRDVRVATATAADTAGGSAGSLVMAIQIKGIDSGKLSAWALKSFGDTESQKSTLGGKVVYGTATAGFGAYLYPKGDIIFYVVAIGTTNLAEGILAKLP